MKKLLIISNMEHYRDDDGAIWGWGPTVQEINQLATLFDRVTHIGCLHAGLPSKSSLPYTVNNLAFVGMPPAGGPRLLDKFSILKLTPKYIRTILAHLHEADVVHVRCPANIPLLAIMLLALVRRPKIRWIKYAGNWQPGKVDRISYTFQRWWLTKNFPRALVTVNGQWPHQPKHIYSFFNPCLSEEELREGEDVARAKQLVLPFRLIFVGAINPAKGIEDAIRVVAMLKGRDLSAILDVIGDGPNLSFYKKLACNLGVGDNINFHGWVKRTDLGAYLKTAHIMLFPSRTEGWPKVLSEAMAYGVVPLAGAVSSIPQYLEKFGCGRAIPADDLNGYVTVLKGYIENPDLWQQESMRGVMAAHHFSYMSYLDAVRRLLGMGHS